jgi:hypothetical protein
MSGLSSLRGLACAGVVMTLVLSTIPAAAQGRSATSKSACMPWVAIDTTNKWPPPAHEQPITAFLLPIHPYLSALQRRQKALTTSYVE